MNSDVPSSNKPTLNAANSPNTSNSPAEEAVTSEGPGARLLAARENRNMAVSEVASLLCLDCAVIRAIEQDDFDKLPSTTFVKGYLRGYAKLLGLDGQSLVDEYDAVTGPSDAGVKVTDMVAERKSWAGRWVVLTLALSAVLALAWFWSDPADQPVSTNTMQPSAALVDAVVSGTNSNATAETGDEREAVDDVIEQLLRGMNNEPAAGSEAAAAEAVDSPVQSEASAPSSVESEPSANENTSTSSDAAEASTAPTLTKLRLVGSQTSWVSIRDDRQKRIFRNNIKAGDSREVSGLPPMIINLGNAEGVDLYVDGQRFDHTAWHKANGTARFVLNPTR